MNKNKIILSVFFASILMCGCTPTNKQQLTILNCDNGNVAQNNYNIPKISIKKYDIISVEVTDPTAKLNELSPCVQGFITEGQIASQIAGAKNLLVDELGNIQFNCIGNLYVEGKTTIDIQNDISNKLKVFIKNPLVIVRLVNFKYSVEGEVGIPGIKTVENNRVNILEAIAASGGLKIFAQRDSVMVIRELKDGKRAIGYVNLKNKDVLNSPYYYLQQNDYVYVPPTRKRQINEDRTFDRYFGIGSTIVGTISSIISLFLILRNNR